MSHYSDRSTFSWSWLNIITLSTRESREAFCKWRVFKAATFESRYSTSVIIETCPSFGINYRSLSIDAKVLSYLPKG